MSLDDCVPRGFSAGADQCPAQLSWDGGGGEGAICAVMERSLPPNLVEFDRLRVSAITAAGT